MVRVSRAAGCIPGFSLVEVLVSIGVMAILLGLLLPVLGRVRGYVEDLRGKTAVREGAILLHAYAGDHRDEFPLWKQESMGDSTNYWYVPLVKQGYLKTAKELDPVAVKHRGYVPILMTAAGIVAPNHMSPGQTLPLHLTPLAAQKFSDIRYPSDKGILNKLRNSRPPVPPPNQTADNDIAWCCATTIMPSSIAMADTSVAFGKWPDFSPDGTIVYENWVGQPVFSTWFGTLGRDRRDSPQIPH
ncbi:MAG: prepilin-type N-terminal cleavage/methylation domain-containing protein [Planctomycetota bacterium]|nr:prepilin-type N-terminal cleavage/methylation domain-containing protein [Planctomycetota bacterium]